ncbi:MAG: CPBP family intramembrane metalloprotease [Pirellulales bacterium]|nr:CPBP family intramembrane metalloprotease [Pirellulales bacterium]
MVDVGKLNRSAEWPVMVFALAFPATLTWVYFVALANAPAWTQQMAYSAGKFIQFSLPAAWVGLVCRERLRWPRPVSQGCWLGVRFSAIVVGVMAALYFAWLRPSGEFAAEGEKMAEKVRGIGITTAAAYGVMAIFYSLVHSLLEEYYWRWFVFGRMRSLMPLASAIVISSLAFMAHHVIVLGCYFGWSNGWTYFFSVATAIGGGFWAWLYHRSGSIYGPWISHLLMDAGIFGIGYDLVRSVGA